MATKSRENKRAISALKKDGWNEHTSGMFYEHNSLFLIQLRWMRIFRPRFVDSALEQLDPKVSGYDYIVLKRIRDEVRYFPEACLVLGTSTNITSLIATLRLLGEI